MIKVEREDEKTPVEQDVDEDIRQFNEWFQTLGNDPLSRPERAIIKTYLAYKLGLVKKG
jgi:hypothetical protein